MISENQQALFLQAKDEIGCVVGSLQSAVEVSATDRDYLCRIAQLSVEFPQFAPLVPDDQQIARFAQIPYVVLPIRRMFGNPIDDIIDTMSVLEEDGSDLGIAAKNQYRGVRRSDLEGLSAELAQGGNVILAVHSKSDPETGTSIGHACHVTLDDSGKLLSISDGNIPLDWIVETTELQYAVFR